MSKNTGSSAFRKIDVDSFNDDDYGEDEEAAVGQETAGLQPGPDEIEVSNLLNQKRSTEALQSALRDPPLKSRDQEAKKRATLLVVRVLRGFPSLDVEKTVKSLPREQQDLLMKYIYKGFEFPQDTANVACLLFWHEKMVNACGLGVIVRVLTDRKRL